MAMSRIRLLSLSVIALVLLAGVTLNPFHASAAGAGGEQATCAGGSIPAGAYASLTVSGVCSLDAGLVVVTGDLTVKPNGALIAAFSGSDLAVGRNILVLQGGVLVLGCLPGAFPCFNDPDQEVGTLSMSGMIGGDVVAVDALTVLLHKDVVSGSVLLLNGGGGVNCDPREILGGSPAYATMEDNRVGGSIIVSGWKTCWLGLIRNRVAGSVDYFGNETADPDGNEIVTNTINGSLTCFANTPAPQVGDSEGNLNIVRHRASRQCAGLAQ